MLIINIIDIVFQVFTILLFARILGSWVPELQQYRAMQFVSFYTDPYLNFFRRIIPPLGMIDISPIFAFISLGILQTLTEKLVIMLL